MDNEAERICDMILASRQLHRKARETGDAADASADVKALWDLLAKVRWTRSAAAVADVTSTPPRSVRVPDHIWQAATARAKAEGTTVTAIVVAALTKYGKGKR